MGAEIEGYYYFVVCGLSASFKNCNFINCIDIDGAAVSATAGNSTFTNCLFDNNKGGQGSHVRVGGIGATFENCIFTNGSTTGKGGAIYLYSEQEVIIRGCTITDNTAAQYGGGNI